MADSLFEVEIEGLPELQQALLQAGGEAVSAVALDAALLAAGSVLLTEAQRRLKPGRLRDALELKVQANASGGEAFVQFNSPEQGFVARMVEFGHLEVTHGRNGHAVGHVPAHPFMRPTLDAESENALNAFAASLSASLGGTED